MAAIDPFVTPSSEPERGNGASTGQQAADRQTIIEESGPIRVGVIASEHPWRQAFGAFVTEHEARLDLHVIRDPGTLRRLPCAVIVVDDTVPFVEAVLAAAGSNGAVMGVIVPGGGGAGAAALSKAGVEFLRSGDEDPSLLTPSSIANAVLELAKINGHSPHSPHRLAPTRSDQRPVAHDLTEEDPRRVNRGLMAVGGPHGPLSLEVAAGLTAALTGWDQAILIDADPNRPLAGRFGLQLQPNIRDLAGALAGRPDPDTLAFMGRRQISNIELPFWTLVGPPNPMESSAVTESEVAAVIEVLSGDIPFQTTLIGDLRAGRSLPCRPILERCAILVAVAEPTPVGLAELLDWWVALDTMTDEPMAVHVVFAGSADGSRFDRLVSELYDSVSAHRIASHHHVPMPIKRLLHARWRGDLVGRRFHRRCTGLLLDLVAASGPSSTEHRPQVAARVEVGAEAGTESESPHGPDRSVDGRINPPTAPRPPSAVSSSLSVPASAVEPPRPPSHLSSSVVARSAGEVHQSRSPAVKGWR